MRTLALMMLPIWRACLAWLVAMLTPNTLLRHLSAMTYRGAHFGITNGGKVVVYPTTSFRDMVRRHRALERAMRRPPSPPAGWPIGPQARA